MKKEIPLRPVPGDSEEIDDRLWHLLVMCWHFEPQARPNTPTLQDMVTSLGIRKDRFEAVGEVGASVVFQSQREAGIVIDYERVEEILLQVSVELSAFLPIQALTSIYQLPFYSPRFHASPTLMLLQVIQRVRSRFVKVACFQLLIQIGMRSACTIHKKLRSNARRTKPSAPYPIEVPIGEQ